MFALVARMRRDVTKSSAKATPGHYTECHAEVLPLGERAHADRGQHGAEALAEQHRPQPGACRHAGQVGRCGVELREHNRQAEAPYDEAHQRYRAHRRSHGDQCADAHQDHRPHEQRPLADAVEHVVAAETTDQHRAGTGHGAEAAGLAEVELVTHQHGCPVVRGHLQRDGAEGCQAHDDSDGGEPLGAAPCLRRRPARRRWVAGRPGSATAAPPRR